FLSDNEQDNQMMVGPIVGHMTLHDALRAVLADAPSYTYRWIDKDTVSVEARAGVPSEYDLLLQSALGRLCRVPIPPTSGRMLVAASRLPSLVSGFEPTVIDRSRIEEIGASSIAELLQHLPQSAFT